MTFCSPCRANRGRPRTWVDTRPEPVQRVKENWLGVNTECARSHIADRAVVSGPIQWRRSPRISSGARRAANSAQAGPSSARPSHNPESSSSRTPSRAHSGTSRENRRAADSPAARATSRLSGDALERLSALSGKNCSVGVKRTPYFAASAFSEISAPSKSVTLRAPMMLSCRMSKFALTYSSMSARAKFTRCVSRQ